MAIFVFHGWLYTKDVPVAADRSGFAEYAVHEMRLALVAFFVLSGFLLYRPWVHASLGRRPRPQVRAYTRSRVARIAPAYYAALIGSVALLCNLDETPGVRLPSEQQLPLFFVFAQNFETGSVMKLNPPMWSLVVEVCFYALLPVLGWLALRLPGGRRAQAVPPLLLLVGGGVFNWAIAGEGLGLTASKSLPAMAPYFALGMLVAVLLAVPGRPSGRRAGWVAAGVLLVVADAVIKAGAPAGWFEAGELFVIVRDLPSAVGFAVLIAVIARPGPARVPMLGARWLVMLGTISYGFYLWHVPVLLFMRGHGLLPLDPWLGTLAALAPSLGLAWLSWTMLERPALRWAARRSEARGPRAPAPAGTA